MKKLFVSSQTHGGFCFFHSTHLFFDTITICSDRQPVEISCPSAELLCVNHLPFTYKVAGFDKSYSSEIMLDYFEVPKNWYEL